MVVRTVLRPWRVGEIATKSPAFWRFRTLGITIKKNDGPKGPNGGRAMITIRSTHAGVAFVAVLAVLMTVPAAAQQALQFGTPDNEPPAVESVCSGQSGAAFGLCNAYCEAMDCDSADAEASEQACEKVRNSFENLTGQELPCNLDCPCADAQPAWKELIENPDSITDCSEVGSGTGQFFGIAVQSSEVDDIPFAGDGVPNETVCGALGDATRIIMLTVDQARSCVDFLVDLAESELGQGTCPEDPR